MDRTILSHLPLGVGSEEQLFSKRSPLVCASCFSFKSLRSPHEQGLIVAVDDGGLSPDAGHNNQVGGLVRADLEMDCASLEARENQNMSHRCPQASPSPSKREGSREIQTHQREGPPRALSDLKGEGSHQWRIGPRAHVPSGQASAGDLCQAAIESRDDVAPLEL
jgi:hypothetical protein